MRGDKGDIRDYLPPVYMLVVPAQKAGAVVKTLWFFIVNRKDAKYAKGKEG